jgi:hypothetical protein
MFQVASTPSTSPAAEMFEEDIRATIKEDDERLCKFC